MTKKKRLFLIDGMALIYRAHFAMIKNPLMTKDGKHTSAIHGFFNMLFKLIRDEKPDYFAVVTDCKEPTFRHKIYTDYKATREKMPEELSEQINPIYELLSEMNIPLLKNPGYEADDIIGTIAKQAENENLDCYVVTSDKDMMQLVSNSTFIYSPGNRFKPTTIYDRNKVIERYGIPPEKFIEYLAMVGDSSDNIPGIDGIGPKTAKKLLLEYDSIDEILKHTDDVRNKRVQNGLINGKELVYLSKELVTIHIDVPIDLHASQLERKTLNIEKVSTSFKNLELYSIIKQLESVSIQKPTVNNDVKKDYSTITDMFSLEKMIVQLETAELISFDTETTSVNALTADLVGMSFSTSSHKGWYIAIEYPEKVSDLFSDWNPAPILEKLRHVLEDNKYSICGQNIKYDALVLSRYGIQLNGIVFDTMIVSHLLYPSSNSVKLDYLALRELNYEMKPIEELIGSGTKQKSMADVPIKDIAFYAVEDADITFQLAKLYQTEIDKQNMTIPYYEIENPLISVLIEMEKSGVFLDLQFLDQLSVDLGIQLDKLEKDIHSLAGTEFNINSPKQLATILFDILELKPIRKRSTDVNVLEVLKNYHPLPESILKYRHLKKLKSTYIDALPSHVNSVDGRVHTSLNQTITSTGRLSSTKPNFQNIPIRTELGREIRKAFIPQKEDCVILSADYSQIELRVMAHMSGEPTLVEAFNNGDDIHRRTASVVFGITPEEVTTDQRRTAKIVNFGIMYGAGAYRMSQELGISMKEGKNLVDSYFKTYPGIRKFIDTTLRTAQEKGEVSTLMGRVRKTSDFNSGRSQMVQAEERATTNFPIQGTAAELIKIAMIRIYNKIKEKKLKTKMILQIHDELLFEVPNEELDDVIKMVVFEMENAMELSVPLKVDYGFGKNWYEAH
jgi:DNA polymerase I